MGPVNCGRKCHSQTEKRSDQRHFLVGPREYWHCFDDVVVVEDIVDHEWVVRVCRFGFIETVRLNDDKASDHVLLVVQEWATISDAAGSVEFGHVL